MAKKKQSKFIDNWSRLTIDQIKNMTIRDINKLSNENLKGLVNQASKFSKQRFNKLYAAVQARRKQDKWYPIPAVIPTDKLGRMRRKKFDIPQNATRYKLLSLAKEYKDFLKSYTSILPQHEKNINNFIKIIKEVTGMDLKKQDYKEFFDIYSAILNVNNRDGSQERNSVDVQSVLGKYETWRTIVEIQNSGKFSDMTPDEIARFLKETLFDKDITETVSDITGNAFIDNIGNLDL